jgi:hypothetical protein
MIYIIKENKLRNTYFGSRRKRKERKGERREKKRVRLTEIFIIRKRKFILINLLLNHPQDVLDVNSLICSSFYRLPCDLKVSYQQLLRYARVVSQNFKAYSVMSSNVFFVRRESSHENKTMLSGQMLLSLIINTFFNIFRLRNWFHRLIKKLLFIKSKHSIDYEGTDAEE